MANLENVHPFENQTSPVAMAAFARARCVRSSLCNFLARACTVTLILDNFFGFGFTTIWDWLSGQIGKWLVSFGVYNTTATTGLGVKKVLHFKLECISW